MESVWAAITRTLRKERPRLNGDKRTDVLIIDGGIAGILTAHFLKNAVLTA